MDSQVLKRVYYGESLVILWPTSRGDGLVILRPTSRGDGLVILRPTSRGDGLVILRPTSRGEGLVILRPTSRGEGLVILRPTSRGEGLVILRPTSLTVWWLALILFVTVSRPLQPASHLWFLKQSSETYTWKWCSFRKPNSHPTRPKSLPTITNAARTNTNAGTRALEQRIKQSISTNLQRKQQ